MEHQLWKDIVAVLATLDKRRMTTDFDFSDERIVQVFYWAVIHDRPTSWACRRGNWPPHLRRPRLPSTDKPTVRVFYWAVTQARPTSWACRRVNWPPHLRRRPLPSNSTISKR